MVAFADLENLISASLDRVDRFVFTEHASLRASIHSMLHDMKQQIDSSASMSWEGAVDEESTSPRTRTENEEQNWNSWHPSAPTLFSPLPPLAGLASEAHESLSETEFVDNKSMLKARAEDRRRMSISTGFSRDERRSLANASLFGTFNPITEKGRRRMSDALSLSSYDTFNAEQSRGMSSASPALSCSTLNAEQSRRMSTMSSMSTLSSFSAIASGSGRSTLPVVEESNRKNRASLLSTVSDLSRGSVVFTLRQQFGADVNNGAKKLLRSKSSKRLAWRSHAEDDDDDDDAAERDQFRFRSLHPDSIFARLWDLLACICVMHDFIVLPLQVFYLHGSSSSSPSEICIGAYWTFNLVFKFFVGYLDEHGRAVTQLSQVAWHYAKSWLGFDAVLIAVDVSTLALQDYDGYRFLLALRLLRMLRLARVFELAKLFRCWIELHLRSEGLNIAFGIFKIIVTILCIAHIFTCGWRLAGTWDAENNWVRAQHVDNEGVGVQYFTAFHWALVQYSGDSSIVPTNVIERAYACGVQFIAFVTAAIMVSDLTTLMTQLQLIGAQSHRQIMILRRYLSDKGISTQLANRIIDNARLSIYERKNKPPEQAVELLKHISAPLLVELHYFTNVGYLKVHPFFLRYDVANREGMKGLCHSAIITGLVTPSDVIYSVGEVMQVPCIYFVINSGILLYSSADTVREVMEGYCVNEPLLWLGDWMQLGTLQTKTTSHVVSIMVHPALEVLQQFRTAIFHPGQYARLFFNEVSNTDIHGLTDIASDFVSVKTIADRVFDKYHRTSLSTSDTRSVQSISKDSANGE